MIDYYSPNIDLTLLGCGFLGNYHLGAIYLLQQIWPRKPYNRICGSSCGGLLGALIVAGVRIDRVLATALDILRHLRGFLTLREPPKSIMNLVAESLDRVLPADAHQRCSRTLGLSITRLGWPLSNEFISCFENRRELLQALVAGCFIPLWSGGLHCPEFRGAACLDGAYTDNKPRFPPTKDQPLRQVEVCPFAGDCHVSPPGERRDMGTIRVMGTSYQVSWNNLRRFKHAMIPCSISSYKIYLVAGHRDMKNYVLNNKLVKCRQCAFTTAHQNSDTKDGCLTCLRLLERVDALQVSDEIISLIE